MAVNAGLPILMSDALIARILEEFKSGKLAQEAWHLKGPKSRRSLIIDVPAALKAHAEIVAKRATGQGLLGTRGDKEGQAPKWWKSQDKAKQTQEKSNNNDLHLPVQTPARRQSPRAIGLPIQRQQHI